MNIEKLIDTKILDCYLTSRGMILSSSEQYKIKNELLAYIKFYVSRLENDRYHFKMYKERVT